MARVRRVASWCFVGVVVMIAVAASTAVAETAARSVTVSEIVVARAIVNGVPEAPVTTFTSADQRIYCFVRVENETGGEAAVFVAFERAEGTPGPARGGIRLSIPSRRYRTFARFPNNRPPGQYRCVVRDADGAVLESAQFEITN
jgi:hypothetical protein